MEGIGVGRGLAVGGVAMGWLGRTGADGGVTMTSGLS